MQNWNGRFNKCFGKKHTPPYGPCWRPELRHPCGCPPKMGEDLSKIWPNRCVNFTPIDKAPAEKSVTVQKRKALYPTHTVVWRDKNGLRGLGLSKMHFTVVQLAQDRSAYSRLVHLWSSRNVPWFESLWCADPNYIVSHTTRCYFVLG